MLRKMYLVSAESCSAKARKKLQLFSAPKLKSPHPPLSKKNKKMRKREKQYQKDKWVKFRKKMGEADITCKTRMNAIEIFYRMYYHIPHPPPY